MKGEHLFANMRSAPFLQRVYLLGGEELVVLQSTVGESSLGDSFQQITDFNDLPMSLFACNVDQSVFEDHEGKVRLNEITRIHQHLILNISPVKLKWKFIAQVAPNVVTTMIVPKQDSKNFSASSLFRLQPPMIGWVQESKSMKRKEKNIKNKQYFPL